MRSTTLRLDATPTPAARTPPPHNKLRNAGRGNDCRRGKRPGRTTCAAAAAAATAQRPALLSLPSPRQVLPALREHRDDVLLRELLKRWDNHKLMVRWLSRFFNYLDRYYVIRHSLHPLKDVGLLCFRGACAAGVGGPCACVDGAWSGMQPGRTARAWADVG